MIQSVSSKPVTRAYKSYKTSFGGIAPSKFKEVISKDTLRYAPEVKLFSPLQFLFGVKKIYIAPLKKAEQKLLSQSVSELAQESLSGIEIVKGFQPPALKRFIKSLIQDYDLTPFLMTALSHKPAILNGGEAKPFLKKINAKGFDTFIRKVNGCENIVLFNEKETKKVIEKNKKFFIHRTGLQKEASIDEIYSVLKGPQSPLSQENSHDLMGIILGYPPKNSILFNLEHLTPNSYNNRKNPALLKKEMKEALYSPQSPYKNFDEDFFKETNALIDSIKEVNHSKDTLFDGVMNEGYIFINYLDEPVEFKKITTAYRHFLRDILKINDNNKLAKDLKEASIIENSSGDFSMMKNLFSNYFYEL